MKNVLFIKTNGETERTDIISRLDIPKSRSHMCSNCDNCYANKCEKVFDEVKKPIAKYDFITDGVQVYDEKGEMVQFNVFNCNEYKQDRERKNPSTKEEILRLNRIKESIKIAYFDAETIEEANETQEDLFRRKQLSLYTGYTRRK